MPGAAPLVPSAPQSRAPPPPPPNDAPAPPSRSATSSSRAPPAVPRPLIVDDEEEQVTEYDGDYDTDIASSAPHKDALKSHVRSPSLEDDSMAEESLHHSGLPSIGPPPAAAPRTVPPPPPSQPPKAGRPSSDMLRAAPPPPPPAPSALASNERSFTEAGMDYDPYNYSSGTSFRPPPPSDRPGNPDTPQTEQPFEEVGSYPTPSPQTQQGYQSPFNLSMPGRSGPRQSADMQRTSTTIRRSTDGPKLSGEQGFIAGDVDLGQSSLWWSSPETPPPVFQNRKDVLFETEETSTTRRGGKQAITRTVYVLFIDYSQTVITAHYESRDPSNVTLEQQHQTPPRSLRQDQLEDAHSKFGAHVAEAVNSKKETVVGDGLPHTLPLALISELPDALLPVGTRAYGALVYANLANASVQQFDEIRPGDVVTFRNAKFQGHRGPMHAKYSIEVGKPDHVGIVLEWDGTKKKVRAWEQGRESKKVKPESFKFGDMRSGEVKVWRVMPRSWVGWEGTN